MNDQGGILHQAHAHLLPAHYAVEGAFRVARRPG